MFEINDDGSLNEACDFHQHVGGSMVQADRQNEPHAHSVTMAPSNNQLIVCDLGLDKVLVYDIDHEAGKIVLNEDASADRGQVKVRATSRSTPTAPPRSLSTRSV